MDNNNQEQNNYKYIKAIKVEMTLESEFEFAEEPLKTVNAIFTNRLKDLIKAHYETLDNIILQKKKEIDKPEPMCNCNACITLRKLYNNDVSLNAKDIALIKDKPLVFTTAIFKDITIEQISKEKGLEVLKRINYLINS